MEASYNNFKLRAVWNHGGWYCGYVDLPEGKNTLNINTRDLMVHGGVSFVNETTIGFDCAHFGDAYEGRTGRVWTAQDVIDELENLARQIEALL